MKQDLAVVAEVGVNHEGDPNAASRLVRLAAESRADAVKFQTYTPERFVSASDSDRLGRVRRFALDETAHRRLAEEAARLGTHFFSTAVTEDMIPFLAELCPVLKIASGDLTFEPVIRAAARTGKPLVLSTGGGTVEEIDQAVGWVRDEVGTEDLPERLILMHCVSAYPTPIEQANVRAVPFLADRYELHIGYSNHVVGMDACLAAVALGASVIEVHFTDRREGRAFRDHQLSFEPNELAEFVRRARLIRASLGTYGKPIQPAEAAGRAVNRKGVVAARDLEAGTTISSKDLMFARPATEFPAAELPLVIGRRLRSPVRRGELIARANLTAE